MLLHKCVIAARESSWIASQKAKVKVVVHMDSTCLGVCMKFCVLIANNCWGMGFGQRFGRSRCECFLLFLIPLAEAAEELT